MIVGANDAPLMFVDLSTEGFRDDSPHLDEFIIHAALDAIDAMLVRHNFVPGAFPPSPIQPTASSGQLTSSTISVSRRMQEQGTYA